MVMKIPCHFIAQIDDSLVKIDTKSHDYSMSFIQVLFVPHAETWYGFWTSSSHGISMVFVKKMMGFLSDLGSFTTKLSSKRHEKIRVTFFTGGVSKTTKYNLDNWHGIVMEFGADLDQIAVDLWHEMTWNFHENPSHIFYREYACFLLYLTCAL